MRNGLRPLLTVALITITATAVFVGGFVAGHYATLPDSPVPALAGADELASASTRTPPGQQELFSPFWQAWDLVHSDYVDQPVDDEKLMQGAIGGMLEALGDQHTSYMSPGEYTLFTSDQSGELQGIGAYVEGAEEGGLRIVSPFPGSPAETAGILPGDLIIEVDGTSVIDMDEVAIINLVRGPAGTLVDLVIMREGEAGPLEFTLTRAKIIIPSVESEMLEGDIGYVKVNDFGSRTAGELQSALEALLKQNPSGLILDLRGNPGGWLDTAIEVSSQFVPGGTLVMTERFGDGRDVEYKAYRGGLATKLPLVVLINPGSASASEIVAGAVQDTGRGVLLGETSYGKGSVQVVHELQGENGAVRVTIARWYTPDGRSIHEQGIEPDYLVPLTPDDHAAGLDPQIDAAILALRGQPVPTVAPTATPTPRPTLEP